MGTKTWVAGMIPHVRYKLTIRGFLKLVYWVGLVAAVKLFFRDLTEIIKKTIRRD